MKRTKMSTGLEMMLEKAPYDPVSAFNAALLLEEERKGSQSVQYFCRRSAEGGYVPAMLKLAGLYITGRYIHGDENTVCAVQDLQAGASWIRRAADTGDSTANYMLAHCYYEGIGMECDPVKAKYFMNRVTFADYSLNPYEPTETLIFGGNSDEIQLYLRSRQSSKVRSLAG